MIRLAATTKTVPILALLCGAALWPVSRASAAPAVPDFSSNNMGWAANGAEFKEPLDGGPGPIMNDPAHPSCGNRIRPECGNKIVPRISDTKNPILQPWAAAQMAEDDKDVLAGTKQAFEAMSRCWPAGVPGIMLFTAEPAYYLQTPKEVTIVYQRGTNIRHVYLDVPHSKTVKPNWYGESIGHYEGDELVIDTIGLSNESFVDSYRTPHSDKLHTVERYKIVDSSTLKAPAGRPLPKGLIMVGTVTVDDPGAYIMKWSASQTFLRHNEPISASENICAENNDANYFHEDEVPIPQTKTPDF